MNRYINVNVNSADLFESYYLTQQKISFEYLLCRKDNNGSSLYIHEKDLAELIFGEE